MEVEASAEYVLLMEQVAEELSRWAFSPWTFHRGWTFSILTDREVLTGPLDVGTLTRSDGAKIWTCFDRSSGCIEAVGYVEFPQRVWTSPAFVWISESAGQIADDWQRTLLPKLDELVTQIWQ